LTKLGDNKLSLTIFLQWMVSSNAMFLSFCAWKKKWRIRSPYSEYFLKKFFIVRNIRYVKKKKMLDRCLLYILLTLHRLELCQLYEITYYNYEMKMPVTWNKERDMYQITKPMSILYQKNTY